MTVTGFNIFQALLAQKGQESSTHRGLSPSLRETTEKYDTTERARPRQH